MINIDLEIASEAVSYEPVSGALVWKVRPEKHFPSAKYHTIWNKRFAGRPAGSIAPNGYLVVTLCAKRIMGHRLAYALCSGGWPKIDIDHIDGDKLNNRISNLRLASPSQNIANAKRSKRNRVGLKGVSIDRGRFRSVIHVAGKRIHLGSFATAEEAHSAYVFAARSHFGSFMRAA